MITLRLDKIQATRKACSAGQWLILRYYSLKEAFLCCFTLFMSGIVKGMVLTQFYFNLSLFLFPPVVKVRKRNVHDIKLNNAM